MPNISKFNTCDWDGATSGATSRRRSSKRPCNTQSSCFVFCAMMVIYWLIILSQSCTRRIYPESQVTSQISEAISKWIRKLYINIFDGSINYKDICGLLALFNLVDLLVRCARRRTPSIDISGIDCNTWCDEQPYQQCMTSFDQCQAFCSPGHQFHDHLDVMPPSYDDQLHYEKRMTAPQFCDQIVLPCDPCDNDYVPSNSARTGADFDLNERARKQRNGVLVSKDGTGCLNIEIPKKCKLRMKCHLGRSESGGISLQESQSAKTMMQGVRVLPDNKGCWDSPPCRIPNDGSCL